MSLTPIATMPVIADIPVPVLLALPAALPVGALPAALPVGALIVWWLVQRRRRGPRR